MTSLSTHTPESPLNPLDAAEDIIISRDLPYERFHDEELAAEIATQFCSLKVWFTFRPELNSMVIAFVFDTKITEKSKALIYPLLAAVNERLWLGHFDLSQEDGSVAFRHTVLLRGDQEALAEQIEDVLDIGVSECERFYPAFQGVLWGGKSAQQALEEAMFDTAGEA